jgi:hypothetical protein
MQPLNLLRILFDLFILCQININRVPFKHTSGIYSVCLFVIIYFDSGLSYEVKICDDLDSMYILVSCWLNTS